MVKFLPVLFLLALLPLRAANKTTLEIKVTNDLGKPEANAEVIVRFFEGRTVALTKVKKSWELRTSQAGSAKLPSIPQGKIQIQVYAKNYQTFGETFDIREEEKTVEIQLKPPQAQYSAHEPASPAK
jgi:hypothetical protein